MFDITNTHIILCSCIILFILYWKLNISGLYKAYNISFLLEEHKVIIICDINHKMIKIYRFFSVPIFDIDDDDGIINYLINTNVENIILDTDGGSVVASDRLLSHITKSKIKLKIYVIRKAYSAGTVLALSADKLYMDKNACLSPTEPQITLENDTYSVKDFMDLYKYKDIDSIDDGSILTYHNLKKMFNENINLIKKLLKNKFNDISEKRKIKVLNKFTDGTISHHMPFNCRYLKKYLNIETEIPKDIYVIYNLFYTLNY